MLLVNDDDVGFSLAFLYDSVMICTFKKYFYFILLCVCVCVCVCVRVGVCMINQHSMHSHCYNR